MLCQELMHRDVVCATPDQTVLWAAQQMKDEDIGFLPVCDDHDRVVGTLTDRDIAVRLVAAGLPADTRISEIMSRDVVTCRPTEDLRVAEARMSASQKSRIPCIDDEGRIQGVISLADLAATVPPPMASQVLRQIKSQMQPTA